MSTEESPLLGHNVTAETDEAAYEEDLQDHLYDRFTQKQKRMIVAVVSWTAIIPCMFFCARTESRLLVLIHGI